MCTITVNACVYRPVRMCAYPFVRVRMCAYPCVRVRMCEYPCVRVSQSMCRLYMRSQCERVCFFTAVGM